MNLLFVGYIDFRGYQDLEQKAKIILAEGDEDYAKWLIQQEPRTIRITGYFKLNIFDSQEGTSHEYNERLDLDFRNAYQSFLRSLKTKSDTTSELNLSNLGIRSIPNEALRFKNLRKIDLSNNKFSNWGLRDLPNFVKLDSINLYCNNLSDLPRELIESPVNLSIRERIQLILFLFKY